MSTAVILVPTLWTDNSQIEAEYINPKAKEKLDKLLKNGWEIKIMNNFEYKGILFTHYVLKRG